MGPFYIVLLSRRGGPGPPESATGSISLEMKALLSFEDANYIPSNK